MRQSALPSFGIEEEFFLLDDTLRPVDAAAAVTARLTPTWHGLVKAEFLASQLELASPVFSAADEAGECLNRFPSELAAASEGALAAGCGTPFDAHPHPTVTRGERYRRVTEDFRGLIDDHQVNGLHVHVGIPDADQAVRVVNQLRGWMPLLLALSANSPYWRGRDTGFASWRTVLLSRWTTHGCPPVFADAEDYTRRIDALVGVGGTSDLGLVAWNLRISQHVPTIEFRVADAQLAASDALAIALLCRSLVAGALADERAMPELPGELLGAALWQAARDGHAALVPDAFGAGFVDVPSGIRSAVAGIPDADRDRLLDDLLARGSGAQRQRTAYEAAGAAGLADCYRGELVRRGPGGR